MGKIKRMDQIKNILQTYQSTKSIKARYRCQKNTVWHYLRLATLYNTDLTVVLALSDEALLQVFLPGSKRPGSGAVGHVVGSGGGAAGVVIPETKVPQPAKVGALIRQINGFRFASRFRPRGRFHSQP